VQTWEGDEARLASPDTGLRAKEQEMLRVAHQIIDGYAIQILTFYSSYFLKY